MFGHGWPLPPLRGGEPWGVPVFGVVLGDGVVVVGVVGVVVVDWVVVEELGAAAAPAMPATAPPVANAPTTTPTLMMLALFIREPPMVAGVAYANHAGGLP
jgi:hypothetical protein